MLKMFCLPTKRSSGEPAVLSAIERVNMMKQEIQETTSKQSILNATLKRIGASVLTVIFLYESYQGFTTGQITISGRVKSTIITGPACLLASVGALLSGAGSALRILTDSNSELDKPFTKKSVPFWVGLILILVAIILDHN